MFYYYFYIILIKDCEVTFVLNLNFRLTPVKKKKEKPIPYDDIDQFKRRSKILNLNIHRTIGSEQATDRFTSFLPDPNYKKAFDLKKELLDKHEGDKFEDVLRGETIVNELGECFKIETHERVQLGNCGENQCDQKILSNLKLVYGIGPYYECQLQTEGFTTIPDLLDYPHWCKPAEQFLELFKKGDVALLHEWMWKYYPKSHPILYQTSAFFNPEEFVIFDIETMGLFEAAIILFGVARQNEDEVEITQFLLKDISNEPSALLETYKELGKSKALISYNGRSFDLPHFQDRLAFYGLHSFQELPHFDLLHYSRRLWRDQVENCKLGTIESHIGIKRDMDLPSSLVPLFYESYLDTNNPGPLIPIIEHNRHDLITLVSLFNKIHEEWS